MTTMRQHAMPPTVDRVNRLYRLLESRDRLLADSIWHRVTRWLADPAEDGSFKLVRDLESALAAAGVDRETLP